MNAIFFPTQHRKTEGEFSETEGLREHISYLTKQLDLQNDQVML